MIPSELKSKLSKGELSSLYLFWVEDAFGFDQAMAFIRESISKKYPGYSEIHWNPEQKKMDQLLEELGSFSFFSTHKLIRVDGDDYLKEEDLLKISSALQNSTIATLLIIPKKKIAFNQASKILKGQFQSVECLKPKSKDLSFFVIEFATQQDKKISNLAARKLVELIGDDLMGLQNQVNLLCIFVGQKKEITLEEVQSLFAESADKDIFALTQHMLQNEKAKTFALLRQLLDQGEVPLIIFSFLARHYRLLMKIKLLEKKRMDAFEMAQIIRLPAFVIEKNLSQAKLLSWKKLIRIYQDLSKTDLLLKSSPMPHIALLEGFILTATK